LWPIANDLRGLAIECSEGTLWVTQEGDHQDHVLEAGQRFVVARRGSVVVEALSDSRLRIAPPLESVAAPSYGVTAPRK
jgi:hypothetical protein